MTPEQMELELTFRRERSKNLLAILTLASIVLLIGGAIWAGAKIAPEKIEVINMAFVAIGTYTGSIAKDITRAFWGMSEEKK